MAAVQYGVYTNLSSQNSAKQIPSFNNGYLVGINNETYDVCTGYCRERDGMWD